MISGIVALTLTPSLCVLILKREHRQPGRFFRWFNDWFRLGLSILDDDGIRLNRRWWRIYRFRNRLGFGLRPRCRFRNRDRSGLRHRLRRRLGGRRRVVDAMTELARAERGPEGQAFVKPILEVLQKVPRD